jgi:hypothetical protein
MKTSRELAPIIGGILIGLASPSWAYRLLLPIPLAFLIFLWHKDARPSSPWAPDYGEHLPNGEFPETKWGWFEHVFWVAFSASFALSVIAGIIKVTVSYFSR